MKKLALVTLICFSLLACREQQAVEQPAFTYPVTEKVDHTDTYFGQKVVDPYRWLEVDTAASVEAWVEAQNEVTFDYLENIPYRDAIEERFAELYNYPKLSVPMRVGEHYFYSKNDGLQNQAVIYVQKGLQGEPEVFIDPNTLSDKGIVSVSLLEASPDKRFMAYSRSDAGSDWREIRVMDIETKEELADRLRWVKFSGASWYGDGFFYSRFPEPAEGQELSNTVENMSVYYHRLGTPQSEDRLIYEDPAHPNMTFRVSLTKDKAWMVLSRATGTDGFETWVKPTDLQTGGFTPLFTGFANKNTVIDHHQGRLLVLSDIDAPNYRIIAVDPGQPEAAPEVIVPEKESALVGAFSAGGKLFLEYLENAFSKVYVCEFDGSGIQEIEMPAPGSCGLAGGNADDEAIFYQFTSFTYPSSIYQYDIAAGTSSLFFQPSVSFNPGDYESRQVWYESKDGTRVSMFVVHRSGLEMDGQNPTYLYGYGGFNISRTPFFSASNIILLENGGVFAMPNLRGGGEYGEAWHRAGMLEKKQNVFDDFITAAEYLIDEGYTSPEKLAIAGGSNGGLLVGACMTQRPDLYAVAFPAVGVMDMLRFHKFTIGWAWVPEYGCADSSETEFNYLRAYSPLHNLKPGTRYPATLVTTADHDDRVVPAHSFKFAATLQEAHAGPEPVMIRIETDAGHGAGKPTSKIIEEQADRWAFMFYNMGESVIYQYPKD